MCRFLGSNAWNHDPETETLCESEETNMLGVVIGLDDLFFPAF